MKRHHAIEVETLQMVLDNIQALVYVTDAETHRIIFANKAMKAQCGEDMEGKKCWEVVSKGAFSSPCPYCNFTEVAGKPLGHPTLSELYDPNLGIWLHINETLAKWPDGRLAHVIMGTDITEVKQHEEALKKYQEELKKMLAEKTENEIMFQSLGDNLPDSFIYQFTGDPTGKFPTVSYLSKGAEAILNIPTEKIKQDAALLVQIFSPQDQNRIREKSIHLTPFSMEIRVTLPGLKKSKWLHFSGIPRKNEHGKIIIDGLGVDITPRKENEKSLEDYKNRLEALVVEKTENEQMLKAMSDNLPDSFVFQLKEVPGSPVSEIVYISKGVKAVCGKTPEELGSTPLPLLELFDPEDLKTFLDRSREKKAFTVEARLRVPGKDGITWISFSEIPRLNYQNEVIWDGIAKDITAQKKTETELQLSQAELLQNAKLMKEISDNMANSAMYRIHVGEDGRLKLDYVSGQMEQITGVPTSKLMENIEILLENVHPEDREEFAKRIRFTAQDLSVASTEFRYLKNGNTNWYKLQSIGFKQGEKIYRDGFVTDITEQKMFESELIGARDKAEESDKLKSTFMANMSHEIRTPMNAIIGFLEFLTNEDDIPREEQKEYMRIVSDNANQLLKLIGDILDISKIDAGQMRITPEKTNVNVLLQDIHTSFQASAIMGQSKNIQLLIDTKNADQGGMFTLDSARLRQILNNLIANAIKFTDQGSVKFGYKVSPEGLHFYVEDTGIGIQKEKLEDLGKPFRQLHDQTLASKYGGTGIGLAISTNLVRLMGGRFWVDSEPRKGSIFQFTIPCKEIPSSLEEDSPYHELPAAKNLPDYSLKGHTLLLVEDMDSNMGYLKTLLKHTEATLLSASNGLEAVEMVKNHPEIEMILMDVRMPGMSGIEATVHIKEIRPDLPVIGQTAFMTQEDKDAMISAGFDDFIAKPVKGMLLHEKINWYLK